MHSRASKAGGVEQERAPIHKRTSRSHHVEVVLERILAKRHRRPEQELPRDLDWEETQGTEAELPAKESR